MTIVVVSFTHVLYLVLASFVSTHIFCNEHFHLVAARIERSSPLPFQSLYLKKN